MLYCRIKGNGHQYIVAIYKPTQRGNSSTKMIDMLKTACFSIVVIVLIGNSDAAAKRASQSNAAQAYNLFKQVYYAPATPPVQIQPKPAAASKASLIQPTTVMPEYDWYPRGRPCSLYDEKNMQEANYVLKQMIDAVDYNDFIDRCTYFRSVVNEYIYLVAYTSALIYRPDTQGIIIPPMEQINPYSYVPAHTIQYAQEQCSSNTTKAQGPVIVDYEYENSTESCMAYFREDILINSNRWVWHIIYNVNLALGQAKDRQGELFYYYHQQILARYDNARLACGLPRMTPLPDYVTPIPESYYPNLYNDLSGNFYPGRGSNLTLQDVPDGGIVISEQELFFQRLSNASVSRTYLATDGTYKALDIHLLGCLTEANAASPNRGFYGNHHNFIHRAISRITNANVVNASAGIMAFYTSAMRDPIFYRWHKKVDNLFDAYTSKNTPYTATDLGLADIVISSVYVQGTSVKNTLETYNQQRLVNISSGIDFSDKRPVLIRVVHLQHENFTHNIVVENKANQARTITIRIFLAPNKDHLKNPIPFSEQRRICITVDIFTALVNPGKQTIKRRAEDSSVTIPTQLSFEQLELQDVNVGTTNNSGEIPRRCLCGWPDTHLIPKGTVDGSSYSYFVMATDGADYQEPTSDFCTTAPVYCGLWNTSYPDKKSMGYPFDREAPSSVTTFTQFASYANMKVQEIIIKHSPDKLVDENGAVLSD